MTSCEGAAADTLVVIFELNTVQAALRAARVGQAFIDVPLTPLPSKTRQTATAVASNPVHTLATIKAVRASSTVINVLFTKQAPGAWWARTLEMVHKVDAGASVLAGMVLALVHFILTVDTLISWNTLTSVSSDEVTAGGTVLAWIGCTLVKLLLAVAPRVAQGALAVMGVASIDTDARVLTQLFNGHAFLQGCRLTGHVEHVTVCTIPSWRTQAVGPCLLLNTGSFVFTWRPAAEVHQGLAVFPGVPQGTGAAVGPQAINTRSRVQARVRAALIDVMEAEGTSETHGAQARERVDSVNTRAAVEAGALSALIDVVFTVDSMEACGARAGVTVDIVRAGPPILTGLTQTFIHVCLALFPNEAGKALAGEGIHFVHTGASILAGVGKAIIDVLLTVHATEARRTLTHVAALSVVADTMVHARPGDTLINVNCTSLTLPARSTQAGEALIVGCLFTHSSILTRVWGTGGQHCLTILACVRQHAVASVAVNVIKAGSLVQTRV